MTKSKVVRLISTISQTAPRWSLSNVPKVKLVRTPLFHGDETKWESRYHYFAYAAFFLNMVAIVLYLIYIFSQMSSSIMYFEYVGSETWLKLNSYSLLAPFGSLPILVTLTYHVKYQIKLVDGDFFGVQAGLVILTGILIHDGSRLIEEYIDLEEVKVNKTSCNHVKHVQNLYGAFKKEVVFITKARKALTTYKEIPPWLQEFQRDNDCCGASGPYDWILLKTQRKFSDIPWSCCCTSKEESKCDENKIKKCDINHNSSGTKIESSAPTKNKEGCTKAIWEKLSEIYKITYICMFVLAFLNFCSIIAYFVHWVAMRRIQPEGVEVDPFPLVTYRISRTKRKTHPSNQSTPRSVESKASDTRVSRKSSSEADLDPRINKLSDTDLNSRTNKMSQKGVLSRLFGYNVPKADKKF